MKRPAKDMMRQWAVNVRRQYSSTSKRIQMTVAPPSTEAESFLFLHKIRSAAVFKCTEYLLEFFNTLDLLANNIHSLARNHTSKLYFSFHIYNKWTQYVYKKLFSLKKKQED
jgi:hypothetical protein